MKLKFKKFILALLIFMLVPINANAIAYGVFDNGAHPNVASLLGVHIGSNGQAVGNGQCTGTLVKLSNSLAYILTAGHCAHTWMEQNSFAIGVSFDDSIAQYNDPNLYTIINHPLIILHPDYRINGGGESFQSDLAMIVFNVSAMPSIANIVPAQIIGMNALTNLKNSQQLKGLKLTAVGYGNPELLNAGSSNAGGPMPFSNDATRKIGYPTIVNIDNDRVQSSMNPINGDSGTCFGDSGGPQFLGNYIATITSTGDLICRASDKSFRLDIPKSQIFVQCILDPNKVTLADLSSCGINNLP